jgi:hypothetical protein
VFNVGGGAIGGQTAESINVGGNVRQVVHTFVETGMSSRLDKGGFNVEVI